jgi:ATP adenylyltransferase
MPRGVGLPTGTLSAAIAERTASALRAGELERLENELHVVEADGIAFAVRVLAGLGRKRRASQAQRASGRNPFLPYEEALRVAELSDTHVCLLNKYYAVPGHVLIATRRFEEQESPLSRADFAALWSCLREIDGMGFYNSGAAAGASQRHKHLQLVPLPLGPGAAFPLASRVAAAARGEPAAAARGLPGPAAGADVGALAGREPDAAAAESERIYRDLLRRAGAEPGRTPYNLLATRRLLWLVPRERERWQGIPVNALGFAGALLVPGGDALARVRSLGPPAVLRAVAAHGAGV